MVQSYVNSAMKVPELSVNHIQTA